MTESLDGAHNAVRERIRAIIAPLEQEVAGLDVEIAAAERRLEILKEDRRQLRAVIKRAQAPVKKGGPKSASKNGRTSHSSSSVGKTKQPSQTNMDYVRDWLARPEIDPEHIVAGPIAEAIRVDGEARGINFRNRPGADAVRRALHAMHENGELRLRSTRGRGGHPIYAKLGGTDG